MKLLVGAVTLLTALVISVVAGFFSVIGLGHLFAGAFWPVVIMGTALETGKLVTASWLKANWKNPTVARQHKLLLLTQTLVLMLITSLGIYGYLAKGHLEQEASLPAVTLKISQGENRIRQITEERTRLEERLTGLDKAANILLTNARTSKEAQAADRARRSQRKDRLDLAKQISAKDAEINEINDGLVPLHLQVSDVSAKLGPVKYVAQLFGWQDPNTAVQMVILMIMFAFDPLAVLLVLAGTLTLGEWLRERHARNRHGSLKNVPITDMADHLDQPVTITEDYSDPSSTHRGTLVPTLPPAANLPEYAEDDWSYLRNKLQTARPIPPPEAVDPRPFVIAAPVEPESVVPPLTVTASIGAAVSNALSANAAVSSITTNLSPAIPTTPTVPEIPTAPAAAPVVPADPVAAMRAILERKTVEREENDAEIVALSEAHDEANLEKLADTIVRGMDLTADIVTLEHALSNVSPALAAAPALAPTSMVTTARFANTAWGSLGATPKPMSHSTDLGSIPTHHRRHEASSSKPAPLFPGTITSFSEPVGIAPEILTAPSDIDNSKGASMDFHSFSEAMFTPRAK